MTEEKICSLQELLQQRNTEGFLFLAKKYADALLVFENKRYAKTEKYPQKTLQQYYAPYDRFIDAVYGWGLMAADPWFPKKVYDVFARAYRDETDPRLEVVGDINDIQLFFQYFGEAVLVLNENPFNEFNNWQCRFRVSGAGKNDSE